MTTDYSVEKAPYPDVVKERGPYVPLLHGFPAGEPILEEFNDYKRQRNDPKTGKTKPLPKSYKGRSSEQVFEDIIKKVFLDWVRDPANGAKPAQVSSIVFILEKLCILFFIA